MAKKNLDLIVDMNEVEKVAKTNAKKPLNLAKRVMLTATKTILTLEAMILLTGCPNPNNPVVVPDTTNNEIYVVSASDNDITEGDSIDINVNHSIRDADTLYIDPDGSGPLPELSIPVNIGEINTTITQEYDTEGTYTPEAWLESDGIKVYGDPIVVSPAPIDAPPTMQLEHEDGGSLAEYEQWNGDVKRVYVDKADDNGEPTIYVKNSSGIYVPFENNGILTFGVDTIKMVDQPEGLGLDYFEITYGIDSNRTLSLDVKVEDSIGQTASDAMLMNILEEIYDVSMSDNSVPHYIGGSAPDNRNIVRFSDNGSQFKGDTILIMSDAQTEVLGYVPKGSYLDYPVEWVGIKDIDVLYKNGPDVVKTVSLGDLVGENYAPIEPIVKGWVKPAGDYYIFHGFEGYPLTFDMDVDNIDKDNDNDPVKYTIINMPYNATFNQWTGEFSWTPNGGQGGAPFNVYIKADDLYGDGISTERTIRLDIDDNI